jgi:hypothetical protein
MEKTLRCISSLLNFDAFSRGRRCRRVALLQRSFGFISVLIFISLRGFRTSRNRISLDWSFLRKIRARNQRLVVLQRALAEKH